MRVLVLFLTVLLMSFFLVFSLHASSPTQHVVKSYLEGGEVDLVFSDSANSHMADVLVLFSAARVVAALAVVMLLGVIPFLDVFVLRLAGSLLVLVPVGLSLVSWDWLFAVFHHVLFPQGNWRFPADSLIIQTYPQEFFVSFALWWGVLVLVSGVFLIVFSSRLARVCSSTA